MPLGILLVTRGVARVADAWTRLVFSGGDALRTPRVRRFGFVVRHVRHVREVVVETTLRLGRLGRLLGETRFLGETRRLGRLLRLLRASVLAQTRVRVRAGSGSGASAGSRIARVRYDNHVSRSSCVKSIGSLTSTLPT